MLARRLAFVALLATCVCAGAASASDGGSGTYTATGSTYYFVFFNDGTTAWQYFYLVGPPGTRFVGGGTISEASPRCAVGEPDARPDEIECGPLASSLAPPQVHLGFAATLAAPVACGSPFQLYVSSTGAAPFTRVGDAVFAGSCAAAAPGRSASRSRGPTAAAPSVSSRRPPSAAPRSPAARGNSSSADR